MKLLILSTLFLFGGLAVNAQVLKKAATAIGCKPVDERAFDYNTLDSADFDRWKKDEFNVASRTSFAAKCRAKDGLRYTFWFEEETYADVRDAEARMSKTHRLPPQLQKAFKDCDGKTLSEYMFRDEFRRGGKVYIISSKAFKLALNDDLTPIRERLERRIK